MAIEDHFVPVGEFSKLEKADGEALIVDFGSLMPIGAIIAWHKSFANTPALNIGWVECNGQTLSDADSVYDGQVIPDLNGDERFIRGSATSGTQQAEGFKSHTHTQNSHLHFHLSPVTNNSSSPNNPGEFLNSTTFYTNSGAGFTGHSGKNTNVATATNQNTGGAETRPINISMVWIIKVK